MEQWRHTSVRKSNIVLLYRDIMPCINQIMISYIDRSEQDCCMFRVLIYGFGISIILYYCTYNNYWKKNKYYKILDIPFACTFKKELILSNLNPANLPFKYDT